jgi:hypothetical protein
MSPGIDRLPECCRKPRQLSAADLRAIERWVDVNWNALLDHWEERIDGAELVKRLQRLP